MMTLDFGRMIFFFFFHLEYVSMVISTLCYTAENLQAVVSMNFQTSLSLYLAKLIQINA